jgi:NADPH-ferrihemoprotein reductase
VFGLGNKTYENYNKMGKVVDKRLEQLGGTRLVQRGEGDDDAK